MNKIIRYANGFFKSLLPLALLGVIANSPALAYELFDLGPNVEPRAINNLGVVVGSSNTDQYPGTAFSWSSGNGFESIKGGTSANAVNDKGQIAGSTIDGAFIVNGNYRDWSNYGAFGINQSGEVAGYKVGTNPYQPRSLPYNPAIFDGKKWNVFDIARLYSRGTREGVYADRFILNAINADYAVGYKYRYGLAGYAAILIDKNGPVNDFTDVVYLPTPYGGRAVDINNSNMIVGATGSNSSTGDYSFAFLYDYDTGTLQNLGTLPSNGPGSEPGLTSSAYDINDLNQVVGTSWLVTANTSLSDPAKYHAFLWENGQMSDLNDLVQLPAGWILTRATAINEYGDIVGVGLKDGVTHGFVLSNGTISGPPPAQNQAPVAVAGSDVTAGKAPLVVNFDASSSSDPDGSITAYHWDFMDGNLSSEVKPVHKFSVTGKYQVTLTVTDNQGMSASSSITITVRKGKSK
ncbi:MAG: PKD domain-containing protein [Pseudomonadota bacterium]|nr:PKD domain-containing protein [Pseudomonadota bacterium]